VIPGFIWIAIFVAWASLFSQASAKEHLKLDKALDFLHRALEVTDNSTESKSRLTAQLTEAIILIQDEPTGPEWQGHRKAAIALVQFAISNLGEGKDLNNIDNTIRYAVTEIQLAITNADGFVPPATDVTPPPTTIASASANNPDFLKFSYVEDLSAKPSAKGTQFKPGPVMDTDDPNDVIRGKPVYFQMGTGKTIHFMVESGKPLTKLIYSGIAFKIFTIEIKDLSGKDITGTGAFTYGNEEKTLDVPLPKITHFEVVITDHSSTWILIKEMRFEANGVRQGPASAPKPVDSAPNPGNTNRLEPAAPISKLTTDQARAVVLIKGDNEEGTGFLVKTADGPAVVTNIHVISDNPNIKITTGTGSQITILSYKGAIDRDLAMIAIKDGPFNYLDLAADISSIAQPGDEVVTPGNSQGGEVVLNTGGKILGIGPERIEFDNPVYHGNSGGPVLHTKSGKVLGVVTEAMKVDISNDLDKASFANRNSAIRNSMRYFGLRLDTVPGWEPYDWRRFQSETVFLDQFDKRSRCLDSFLNAPDDDKPEDTLWRKDEKIVKANNSCFDQGSGADASQRMDAIRVLYADLNDIVGIDMDAIQNSDNFYSFDRQRTKDEIAYRKALKTELDNISDNISRLGSLPRTNN